MKVVLPLRAELGMKIWWHAPAVHAIKGEKIVCIEPGDEALYPSATEYRPVVRQWDHLRRNRYDRDRRYVDEMRKHLIEMSPEAPTFEFLEPTDKWPKERFIPQPFQGKGITCDVVVCPRRRIYGAEKNWPEWFDLTDRLTEGMLVFAAGAPDSSYEVPCEKAWDHDRFLDASIEAMLSAKLVVSTDAGLAHLAVLCGRPLLMITHDRGMVAPGPVVNEEGKHLEDRYWPVKLERYEEANHRNSLIRILPHGWYDPKMVYDTIVSLVGVLSA